MSGISLRDQLKGLALERQKQREQAQLQEEKKKAPAAKSELKHTEKEASETVTKSSEQKAVPRARLTPMPGLPVSERAQEIIEAIRKNRVLILCGETGSGGVW